MSESQNQETRFPDFACPKCGDVSPVDFDVHEETFECSECKARVAYSVLQPRVVVGPDPSGDPRFVGFVIGDASYRLEKRYAHLVGLNLISITGP